MILDFLQGNPMLSVVLAGEIAFWVLIGAGLGARYLLRAPRLGAALLASTVLVDLGVLVAAVIDVRGGGATNWSHGLAAAYVGISVAFGRRLIAWADARFAHLFAGGPAPQPAPKAGPEWVRHEWQLWIRYAVAWAIACGLMLAMIVLVDAPERTESLWSWIWRLTIVLVVWLVGWPLRASLVERDRTESLR